MCIYIYTHPHTHEQPHMQKLSNRFAMLFVVSALSVCASVHDVVVLALLILATVTITTTAVVL